MTFAYTTPILGILNDTDSPSEAMVVVVWGKPETLRWAYVGGRHGFAGEYPYRHPDNFTPLAHFGVWAMLTPDGKLSLHRNNISIAKYEDGKPRRWQGADDTTIKIRNGIAGFVVRAVNLEFESRRSKASAS